MREIKFKAFCKKENKIYDVQSIEFVDLIEGRTGINVYVGKNVYEDCKWVEEGEYVLMQFTGLKDKTGKEIYEGDISKVQWQKDSIGGYLQSSDAYVEKEEIVVVEWMNIGWGFKKKDGKYFSLPKNSTIEIIGNIYEHKNLLDK